MRKYLTWDHERGVTACSNLDNVLQGVVPELAPFGDYLMYVQLQALAEAAPTSEDDEQGRDRPGFELEEYPGPNWKHPLQLLGSPLAITASMVL